MNAISNAARMINPIKMAGIIPFPLITRKTK